MWMHFPLEFAFEYADRLAFWHSDVLPPVAVMRALAAEFDTIQEGEYIGVPDRSGLLQGLRRLLKGCVTRNRSLIYNWIARRWFEVVGCTTRSASRSQFETGCGIWRHITHHPNASPKMRTALVHYDHGVGLHYWCVYHHGKTRRVAVNVEPYHYTTR